MKHGLLCVHQEDQSEDVDYWRIVVPDDIEVKNKILSECHSVPYIAHPGVQRTLFRIRKVFYWKGQTGDDVCGPNDLRTHVVVSRRRA